MQKTPTGTIKKLKMEKANKNQKLGRSLSALLKDTEESDNQIEIRKLERDHQREIQKLEDENERLFKLVEKLTEALIDKKTPF